MQSHASTFLSLAATEYSFHHVSLPTHPYDDDDVDHDHEDDDHKDDGDDENDRFDPPC